MYEHGIVNVYMSGIKLFFFLLQSADLLNKTNTKHILLFISKVSNEWNAKQLNNQNNTNMMTIILT